MSEWISVEDRLPSENQGDVLTFGGKRGIECAMYVHEDRAWYSSMAIKINGVTHWMPLPEPPA